VTGADAKGEREGKIAAFKAGRLRCLINVNVLTTGFNVPHVDLVALVRATASTGLYVQMVGRGTRLADGKVNCLVLDYGQNVERHGFIDAVKPRDKDSGGNGTAPVKMCEVCQTMCHTAVRVCPECGNEFPAPTSNHGTKAYGGAILSTQVQAEWVDVDDVHYSRHRKDDKPDSVKVTYQTGIAFVSEWLCPDHGGYAASRYHARMSALGAKARTTDAALAECNGWKWPNRIKVKPSAHNPKFMEIVQLDYSQPNPMQNRGRSSEFAGREIDELDIPF
jgi:DNA repair protein RadD